VIAADLVVAAQPKAATAIVLLAAASAPEEETGHGVIDPVDLPLLRKWQTSFFYSNL
jgi:hypothetical protein